MKRLYGLLLMACFAVASCSEEIPMPDYSKDNIVLNIYNSPMTKADGDQGTAYERQLNRLDCFFYVRGKTNEPCVYYRRFDIKEVGQSSVAFYVNELVLNEIIPSGQICDVFVIANYPGTEAFAAKQAETDIATLGQYVLDMTEDTYDGIDKPFVMTGTGVAVKGRNSTVSADIALKRVAAKVTMEVKVPKSIIIDEVKWAPVIADDQGNVPFLSSFRHGATKTHLYGDFPEEEDSHLMTEKVAYKLFSETADEYVFQCEIPFYTYARTWEKGSDHAAYMTFQMPWGIDENLDGAADKNINTYYYQILVNAGERCFKPNYWYDLSVKVGVLGSLVESIPKELEELSYYVIDWTEESQEYGSGDRHEEVEIQKFNYLEVPQTYIEMNNVPEINIRYNASHKIGVEFTGGRKSVPALPTATDKSAFYINNGSGTPQPVDLTVNLSEQFTDNNKGLLKFTYTLSDAVYSPAYVFVTIWLDVDGDGVHDSDEVLTQDVTIVMYPAIYIIGEESLLYSVFVNGNYNTRRVNSNADLNNMGYLYINGQKVGKATGYDTSRYMHVITISAFNADEEKNYKFAYNNNGVLDNEYIIGDPRVRESNTYGVSWANDNSGATLENYYPTSTEANAYQVIAPKFRISSKLAGYSHSTPQGAAYRCASYQEAGYPAGRWRMPTTAEVLFVIRLQEDGKIENLFHGSRTYLSATDRVQNNDNNFTLTKGHQVQQGQPNDDFSVRCVYDEWYWGSEPEARKNADFNNYGGYEFTWGDRKIY